MSDYKPPCWGRTEEFFYDGPRPQTGPAMPEWFLDLSERALECGDCKIREKCLDIARTLGRSDRAFSVWGGYVFRNRGKPVLPFTRTIQRSVA